jgi:hypothetical protein
MEAIGNSSPGSFRVLANAEVAARTDKMAMKVRVDLIIVRPAGAAAIPGDSICPRIIDSRENWS